MVAPDRGEKGKTVFVELAPRPQELVRILEGDSFVVPRGKILVIRRWELRRQ